MTLKKTYTAPASQTLELKPQGLLCWSGEAALFWLYNGSSSDEWGREGYSKGTEGYVWD